MIGDGRPDVVAMLNIDLTAVGSWAERNNVVYASYQELAGMPKVYSILSGHVAAVNRFLAEDPALAPCQIRRFPGFCTRNWTPMTGRLRGRRKVTAADHKRALRRSGRGALRATPRACTRPRKSLTKTAARAASRPHSASPRPRPLKRGRQQHDGGCGSVGNTAGSRIAQCYVALRGNHGN